MQKDAFQNTDFSRLKYQLNVARYSFSGSIPSKFEHKLRRHKQRFGKKITTTVVLDKDENLLRSGLRWLQRHRVGVVITTK